MLQIKNTLGGGKPEGLYAWKKNSIGSEVKELNNKVSTLPYDFKNGSAVVYNNEIHIFCGEGYGTNHYKWDGNSWVSASTIPYDAVGSSVVVYNNKIHIMGGNGVTSKTKHYEWNGSSWKEASTLPYKFYDGRAVVFNNEIHIMGCSNSSYGKYHYKWDGSSWSKASTLPYVFYNGSSAIVFQNEIHILGGNNYSTNHYKWDGNSWVSASTLPYEFVGGDAVIFNDKIHILGGNSPTYHYELNGSTWESVNTLPYSFKYGTAIVYNDAIHIMGSASSTSHYSVIGNVQTYTFLDYIVSDKETAYPDGAVHTDGYYYEKVAEGAKVAYGSVNPTGDLTKLVINHGLGKEPTLVIGYCESNITNVFNHDFIVEGVTAKIKYNDSIYTRTATNVDVNTMEIPKTTANWGGYNYRWIAIAE